MPRPRGPSRRAAERTDSAAAERLKTESVEGQLLSEAEAGGRCYSGYPTFWTKRNRAGDTYTFEAIRPSEAAPRSSGYTTACMVTALVSALVVGTTVSVVVLRRLRTTGSLEPTAWLASLTLVSAGPNAPPPARPPRPTSPGPALPPPLGPPHAPPSLPRVCELCKELNKRWASGHPTNDWTSAGVLLHALDGGGVDWHGFTSGAIDLSDPLRATLERDSRSYKGAGRVSATLVNSRHPDVFRCFLKSCRDAAGESMLDLPGLVLSPSSAVHRRVSCMTWCDDGSVQLNCQLGAPDCIAGCPPKSSWQHQRTVARWGPDQLDEMMAEQDRKRARGSCENTRGSWECDDGWHYRLSYNEIILDKWHMPWTDKDLVEMIDGVFVSPRGTEAAMSWARAVQADLQARLGRDAVPLMFYDANAPAEPFQDVSPLRPTARHDA